MTVSDMSSIQSDWDDMPRALIEQRLLQTGIEESIDEFELVPDYVSKEVVTLFDEEQKERLKELHKHVVSHVKTGVWEVQCFHEDGTEQQPFYIVTGVAMEDRVDMKKLRKAIFAGRQSGQKRRPKIRLAPTEIGEERTGFKSGTMMPICHSVNMELFMGESIAKKRGNSDHRIHCGSGIVGKCLSISTDTFMRIAEASPSGVTTCPLIQKHKMKLATACAKRKQQQVSTSRQGCIGLLLSRATQEEQEMHPKPRT